MSEAIAIIERPVDQRQLDELTDNGVAPLAARVLAARNLTSEQLASAIRPGVSLLDAPDTLPDIHRAAERIALAIVTGETIAVNTDFDVDGTQSAYVIYTALTQHFGCPVAQVQHYVGNRLRDGYGLSLPVMEQMLAASPRPGLVITADQGSSDEPRIAQLAAAGIDVIVTDHHAMPAEGPPPSAHSVVSPAREDSLYPDPTICGAMVSLLLMSVVRRELIAIEHLQEDAPNMSSMLGAVAAATVADCVDLRSTNNRAVILAGLSQINRGTIPAWRAFLAAEMDPGAPVTAETLAFKLGPNINSRSRVADPKASFLFMTATNDADAAHYWSLLAEANATRREIERSMTETALGDVVAQPAAGRLSIVHFDPEFSPGVHGIVASRVVEHFGRPCVLFSPHNGSDDIITGSARTVDGCHIKDAFDHVYAAHPNLMLAFGGHRGAGGLKIHRESLPLFSVAFEAAVAAQIGREDVGPRLYVDGELDGTCLNMETLRQLDALQPYGREFAPPLFRVQVTVRSVRAVGDGSHLSLVLATDGLRAPVRAIWFRCMEPGATHPLREGQRAALLVELAHNHFRGTDQLQLIVRHAAEHLGELGVGHANRTKR